MTWRSEHYGNNGYFNLSTVTMRMRRPVAAGEELVVGSDGDGQSYTDVAADGAVTVYGVMSWADDRPTGGIVWRVGAKATAIPNAPAPGALAVNGSRVVVVPPVFWGCSCSVDPSWSPDGGTIAYATKGVDHDWEIVTAKPGAPPKRITANDVGDFEPDWSPDGTRLIYVSGGSIVSSKADGTDAHTLAAGDEPAWSPSGEHVAFAKSDGIWVMSADGSGERRVIEGNVWDPAWSPDGSQLAFSRSREGGSDIVVTDLAGTSSRRVATGSDPAWSPDGGRLAYSAWDFQQYDVDVRTVRPDGTDDRALTNNSRFDDYEPDWSPDGTRVAFASGASLEDGGNTPSEVFAMPADGGAATQLTATRARSYRKPVQIRNLAGALVSTFLPAAQPTDVALSDRVAVTISRGRRAASIELFDAPSGRRLGAVSVPKRATNLSVSGGTVVFSADRRIWALDARSRKRRVVATAAADPVGVSIEGRRVAWAENFLTSARIRGLMRR